MRDGAPLFAVECKTGERDVSRAFKYFKERTSMPRWFQVHLGKTDRLIQGVRVLPFAQLCDELHLP